VSVGRLLETNARLRPDQVALYFEDHTYTFAQLDQAANRVAHTLRAVGARRGDVLALLMENRPEYLATILGANKLGVCVALVNPNLAGDALAHAVSICGPSYVLVGGELVASLAAIRDRLPVALARVLVWREERDEAPLRGATDITARLREAETHPPASTAERHVGEPCVYIYTSGTTGLPKAARMSNGRVLKAASLFGRAVLGITPSDVVYGSGLPLYHSIGFVVGFCAALLGGGAYAMRRRFSASQHWEDVARYGATVFTYIGELCRYLVATPPHPLERRHRLRAVVGAGLRPDIWATFEARFAIPKIYEFYGATEGNVGIVNLDGKAGMLGRLMPGQAVAEADQATGEFVRDAEGRLARARAGEVGMLLGQINRVNGFDGYVDRSKNESKIVRDPFGEGKDYFHTGDLVRVHEHGYVAFVDRVGDTFRFKGENVSTSEVAELLHACPGVQEANVYGVEVPGVDGRAGMAALVVDEPFDLERFAAHCAIALPAYARPVFVRIVPAMDRTGTFKQVKMRLRDEGYDPAKVGGDPLYVLDPSTGAYEVLTTKRRSALLDGSARL
jgi:acyl-CoA synthetase (AMP-forming)/AMP-acid ligase II